MKVFYVLSFWLIVYEAKKFTKSAKKKNSFKFFFIVKGFKHTF